MGIIGGADGPTAVFITTSGNLWLYIAVTAAAIAVGIIAGRTWKNRKQKR